MHSVTINKITCPSRVIKSLSPHRITAEQANKNPIPKAENKENISPAATTDDPCTHLDYGHFPYKYPHAANFTRRSELLKRSASAGLPSLPSTALAPRSASAPINVWQPPRQPSPPPPTPSRTAVVHSPMKPCHLKRKEGGGADAIYQTQTHKTTHPPLLKIG